MRSRAAGHIAVRDKCTGTSHKCATDGRGLQRDINPPYPARFALALLAFTLTATSAQAQQSPPEDQGGSAHVAFVHVNVIPMDRERVETDQTVLVRGERIIAVGPAHEVVIPDGVAVIDGGGRYLVPGLTDAHVHIRTDMPWARARTDFGEAPLYLAYGITTIVNLHGTTTQLEWKRRIANGDLLGPTIYTSGEHVNEPRVNTPAEARQEVEAQAREGYDVIKFHEVWNRVDGRLTKTGLSRPTYIEMNETARQMGIPIVGHAPVNLGFDALLEGRQPLAHIQALFPIYFLPLSSSRGILFANAAALLVLTSMPLMWTVRGRRRGRDTATRDAHVPTHERMLTGLLLAGGLVALSVQLDEYFRSSLARTTLLTVFLVLTVFVAAVTVAMIVLVMRVCRQPSRSIAQCLELALIVAAGSALTVALACFWVPASWRYTDSGIDQVARNLRDSGIMVQTTLVVDDRARGPDSWKLIQQDPAIDYLTPETRRRWRRLQPAPTLPSQITAVTRKLTAALHEKGVLLVAGSDAMGRPLIPPGSSLHRELQLLTHNGLTPYEALRTATVNPATFLGKQREFGMIAAGMRADLLLIDGNPLHDLNRLKQPLGVMVRGRWLTRTRLQELLAELASAP